MYRFKQILLLFFLSISIAACKKKNISVQAVTKLESHTTSRLNSIQFLDNNTCIIGGGERFHKAEILRSTDGGNTWTTNNYPEAGKGMYGLGVNADNRVLMSGFDGKVLYSDNKGQDWKFHQLSYWKYYIGIACPEKNKNLFISSEGYLYGNVVITDSLFNVVDTQYYKFGFNDIAMADSKIGYISGYGTILRTTDGGDSWAYTNVKNDNFMSVFSLDANHAWTCGYGGSIFRTTDGGNNWEKLRNGNNMLKKSYALLSIYFKDNQNGWACGENGLLIGTTDGGSNWKEYDSFTENALRGIAMAPNGNLIVVGDNGSIYKLQL